MLKEKEITLKNASKTRKKSFAKISKKGSLNPIIFALAIPIITILIGVAIILTRQKPQNENFYIFDSQDISQYAGNSYNFNIAITKLISNIPEKGSLILANIITPNKTQLSQVLYLPYNLQTNIEQNQKYNAKIKIVSTQIGTIAQIVSLDKY